MYDVEGADSGREWIELTNTGSAAIDIGAYKLFENDTHHKLVLVSGAATLSPGASAILADNAEKFSADWPHFTGTLFSSAFSLSNVGEALALKDEKLQIVDSVSYTASLGAKGEGSSLHKDLSGFIAALPNPGVYPGEIKKKAVAKPVVAAKPALVDTKSVSPSKKLASTASSSIEGAAAVVRAPHSSGGVSYSTLALLAGLASIIALGIAGALFVKQQKNTKETIDPGDEFTIVDN